MNQYGISLRMGLAAGVLFVSVTAPLGVSAKDTAAVVEQAKASVAAKDYQGASRAIEKAQRRDKDAAENFDLNFLQGVALQQRAGKGTDATRELEAAVVSYRKALALRPDSAATHNNLADVLVRLGRPDEARAEYERAVAGSGPRRAFYAINYAKFLVDHDPGAAVQFAEIAENLAPDNAEVRTACAEIYKKTDPDRVAWFARKMLNGGYSELAQELALYGIASNRPAEERRSYVILLAQTFNADRTASFRTSTDILKQLDAVAADPDIGPAAKELVGVLRAPPAQGYDLRWWQNQRSVAWSLDEPGRLVMGKVLRTLGDHLAATDKGAAEGYLLAAIEFGVDGPDPEAFLRTVELYVANEDRGRLQKLMDRYQWELFTEKGRAYAKGDWPQIYRMHIALGMTYAYLKVWKSQYEYQNAIFQLEHAQIAADRANKAAAQKGAEPQYSLPVVAVAQLVEGYHAVGLDDRVEKFTKSAVLTALAANRENDVAEILEAGQGRRDAK